VIDLGTSSLIIAQVLAASADPSHFVDGNWIFENGLELVHHLGGTRFYAANKVVEAVSAR